MSQIASTDRIISIDVLRGIAIMGIVLVNAPTLNGPPINDAVDFAFQQSLWDIWYSQAIFAVAMEKFYPIFAVLFGVSASIFMTNRPGSRRLFFKRQMLLMLIGCAHVAFIWWGDILIVYAVLGLFLLLLENSSLKIFWCMLTCGLLISGALVLWPATDYMLYDLQSSLVYLQGSFLEVSKQRMVDYLGAYFPGVFYRLTFHNLLSSILYFWQLLLLFALGFYLQSSGLLKKLTTDKAAAFKALKLSFVSFLTWGLLSLLEPFEFAALWQPMAQGLFYGSFVLYLCHTKVLYYLAPWAQVGKMSLTNYLFHTASLSLLFYGYGFGLYGQIGPFTQAPLVVALMLISLVLSNLWLKYFNFGPIEWLWRAATYGRFSPMLKSRPPVIEAVRS